MTIEKLVYGHEEYAVPVNIVDEIPNRRIAVGLDRSRGIVYFVTGYKMDVISGIIEYKWQPVQRFDTNNCTRDKMYMTLEQAYEFFDKIYLLHSWKDFKDIPNIEPYS